MFPRLFLGGRVPYSSRIIYKGTFIVYFMLRLLSH
jgi:hypothetical protein